MKKTDKNSNSNSIVVKFIDDSKSSSGKIVATRGKSTKIVNVVYFTESQANKILDAVDRVVLSH